MDLERLELERMVLALACRGLLHSWAADTLPHEAITGASRLLAWAAACVALDVHGAATTPDLVRVALIRAPRLDLPESAWTALMHAAHREIDAAERVQTLNPRALDQLLRVVTDTGQEGRTRS